MPSPPYTPDLSSSILEEAWRSLALQEDRENTTARILREQMTIRVAQQIADAQTLASRPEIRHIQPISLDSGSGHDTMSRVLDSWNVYTPPLNLFDDDDPEAIPLPVEDEMTNSTRYVQRVYCNTDGTPDGYDTWQEYADYLQSRLTESFLSVRHRTDYTARIRECNDIIGGGAIWNPETMRYTFSWMGPMDYIDATSYSSDGAGPEWFTSWPQYLSHMEANPLHWSRLEDRRREANEVINGTFYEFNRPSRQYTWSWMMPEQPGKKSKSLLQVVKYIKKNKKTLKESSRCWSWLVTCKLQYFRKNRNNGEFTSGAQLATRFLKGVNRYINDPNFEIISYQAPNGATSYLFKKFLVEYHMMSLDWNDFFSRRKGFTTNWLTKTKADNFVKTGVAYIDNGKYYSMGCKVGVWKTPKDTVLHRETADYTKHDLCTGCRQTWYKSSMQFSKALDEVVCPVCSEKKNADHDLDSVHGGYHSHRGEWKFFIRRKDNEQTLPMGIEIEMASRVISRSMSQLSMEMYNTQRDFNKDWHEIYFERDGSIGDNGLECVSNPMTLDFAKDYWEKMLPVFRAKCIGWRTKAVRNTDTASYGIHLTCHRKYFTNLQLARTVKFFNDINNHDFLKAIAQRDYLYGNESWCLKTNPSLADCQVLKDLGATRIQQSRGKYSPVNIKVINLIEFRMFASTLNQESFMKNYEFLDSFWHWVRETSYSTDWKQYIQWLAVQKQTVRRWPNLVAYIYRDHFYVKNSHTTAYKAANNILPVFKKLSVNKILIASPTTVDDVITKDEDACA